MDENKLYKSLIICVLLLGSLSLCTFIPRISVAGFEFKRVDLFSELRIESHKYESNRYVHSGPPSAYDLTYLPYLNGFTRYLSASSGISPLLSLPNFAVADGKYKKRLIFRAKVERSSVLKPLSQLIAGNSLFKDYSSDGNSFVRFFQVLNDVKKGGGKGRIAIFGDSFIEGDIFCADLRNTLQDIFGGNGVGFVPITSEVAQYRITIGHTFSGFHSYSVVKKETRTEPYGAGGYCFTADKENDVTYSINPKLKHLNLFHDIKLYYTSPEKTVFKYRLNNSDLKEININSSDQLQQKVFSGANATTVSFNFPASDTIKLYGASFEDSTGIYVDNFGLRGNSGLNLSQISEAMHRQFNQYQDYKLIILQYGLNVIAPDTKDLSWYVNPMINVIQRLKRCYPEAAILLMSVSDRSTKVDGQYHTMESVPIMIEAQREIARKTQIAFYNLFEAMGGENSMVSYVESDPPLANKDYTHLNYQGGRRVAGIFVKSLINEFQKYNDQIKKPDSAINSLVVSSK